MSASSEESGMEELLGQGAWARRLAYRLVHEADAPDLLQEAWIAARAAERPERIPPSAWFGGVVRILGLRRRRGEARRQARERQAGSEAAWGAPELTPEALLERAQLQRLLSDLVLGLDEPFRSTVLLRYDEGLSAAEIARRLAIPSGTVRWRLKEALDRLRRQLEERNERDQRRSGSTARSRAWALALGPLAGPRRRSPLLGWAPALAVSAALLLGGLALWRGGERARPSLASSSLSSSSPASPVPPLPPGPTTKEPTMRPTVTMLTLAMVLASGETEAGKRPLPASSVARFQVPLGGAPIRGPASAKVTILEFTDYECPFCAQAGQTMKALLAAYPEDLRYQVINHPLPFHKNAPQAARAALAAAQQGRYWEMHARLFAHPGQLARADLDRHAQAVGLDLARFRKDFDGPTVANLMEIDEATVKSVRTEATPTFFINGRMVSGARPLAEFEKWVEEEIAYADRVLAAGVPPEQLYNQIISQGAPEIPAHASPGSTAAAAALKKCVPDQKLLRNLQGTTISPGGAYTTPARTTLSAEQNQALGCLARELADKGVGLKL